MIRYAVQDDFETLHTYDRRIGGAELRRSIDAGRVLTLFEDGAFAGWLRSGLFWDEIPFLNMLYFLEPYRGRGLGKRLTEHWEREMSLRGYRRVLTSTLSNERGQLFFRQNGYVDCGCLLLPGEPLEILLSKDLA